MIAMLDGRRASFHQAALPILARRHELEVVVLGASGPLDAEAAAMGIPTMVLDRDPMRRPVAAGRALRAHVRDRRPDLVHAHEALPALLAFGGVRPAPGAATVYHRHHGERGTASHALVSRLAARGADLVVAVSAHAARCAVADDHAPSNRVTVAHNGVTAPVVASGAVERVRASLGLDADALVVVAVGRLRAEKGIEDLIESVPLLRPPSSQPVEVVVVGDGPRRSAVEAALARTGSEPRVHLVGEQHDVGPYYAMADVVAVPSRREAFGLVAVEAMSLGRPVVATAVGGLVETIVDGESGVLVQPGSAIAMAEAVSTLLADPARRARLGDRARERALACFTTEQMVDRWCVAYEAAASRRTKR